MTAGPAPTLRTDPGVLAAAARTTVQGWQVGTKGTLGRWPQPDRFLGVAPLLRSLRRHPAIFQRPPRNEDYRQVHG